MIDLRPATLRQSILLRSNGDELTVRDAQALLDGSKTECPNFPGGRVRLVDELARAGKEATSVMMQIEGRLHTIRSWLVERLGESGAPEMEQLIKTATLINRAGRTGDDAQPDETATSSPSQASATTPAAAPANHTDWRSVQLNSRADAQLMLEKVKLYFAQHEPSHPAPLMIDRVQRLIELDFMAIVRDLAPDGVQQLENIFGRHP